MSKQRSCMAGKLWQVTKLPMLLDVHVTSVTKHAYITSLMCILYNSNINTYMHKLIGLMKTHTICDENFRLMTQFGQEYAN